jgi:hypothetical protein
VEKVETEVLVVDEQAAAAAAAKKAAELQMMADYGVGMQQGVKEEKPMKVLSTIKKSAFELLCPQHNPVCVLTHPIADGDN